MAPAASPAEAAPAAVPPSPEVLAAYKRLQNGSDIRGVAVEGVPGEPVTLTAAHAFFIGAAYADWLAARLSVPPASLRVSVGQDPRISGPLLSAALTAGLASRGAAVARFGLATTPALFMSCILPGHAYDGGVMLTASHLPYNRNGAKFFTSSGGLEKADIADLLARAAGAAAGVRLPPGDELAALAHVMQAALATDPAAALQVDFMPVYAAHLRELIKAGISHPTSPERPLEGFRIAVDAGNGAGGFIATQVLAPLGADVSGSQFLEPDGRFPNHVPNPEDKAAMAAGVAAVRASGADLGIVFDTDVDRSAVVAGDGQPINSNRYIALMATIALRKYPGTTIVTDSVTSNGLTDFIRARGGHHFRFKRGYKNVIGKGVELAAQGVDCALMMETSGHGAMAENYYLDDGAFSAMQIVVELVRRRLEGRGDLAAELLAELKEPAEAAEYRLRILVDDWKAEAERVLGRFHDWVASGAGGAPGWALEEENWEGWRVAIDEGDGRRGWALLRASLHDPLLVLNVESEVAGGVEATVKHIRAFLAEHTDSASVDSSKLPGFDPDD